MTLIELRNRVIDEGITSVLLHETGARQKGALRGFERCRDLYTPQQYQAVLTEIEQDCRVLGDLYRRDHLDLEAYWEKRYEQLQVQMVYDTLSVTWGHRPMLPVSAIRRYARIVGVRYAGDELLAEEDGGA